MVDYKLCSTCLDNLRPWRTNLRRHGAPVRQQQSRMSTNVQQLLCAHGSHSLLVLSALLLLPALFCLHDGGDQLRGPVAEGPHARAGPGGTAGAVEPGDVGVGQCKQQQYDDSHKRLHNCSEPAVYEITSKEGEA